MDENCQEQIDVKFIKWSKDAKKINNINKEEQEYLNLLGDILREGDFRQTRNASCYSLFGKTIEFDLNSGFPILTTKKVFFRGVFEELLFFLRGDTNTKHLSEKGIKIWEPNTTREFLDSVNLKNYEEYDMGPLYGFNFLHFGAHYNGMNCDYSGKGFNQVEYCLDLIKKDPFSRRIIMTSFNPAQAKEGCLYPCHSLVLQFYMEAGHKLSLSCYNRSQDIICGFPFNCASSALLVHLFCEVINNDPGFKGHKIVPGRLIMNLGDVHLYDAHYSLAIRQILREPYAFPKLRIKKKLTTLTDFKFEDFELVGYDSYPAINAHMIA